MKKSDLQKALDAIEGDPEIVLRASALMLKPVEDFVEIKVLYRTSFGLYRQIHDDDDFTDEQKADVETVVLLRS